MQAQYWYLVPPSCLLKSRDPRQNPTVI
jgi:hypothetical protein